MSDSFTVSVPVYGDLMGDIPIIQNDLLEVGRPVMWSDDNGRTSVFMHSLDAIALIHQQDHDYDAWLEESMAWIVRRAHRRADVLIRRLERAKEGSHG